MLKMNALNLVYEGMFSGYNYVCELRKKYDCNMGESFANDKFFPDNHVLF